MAKYTITNQPAPLRFDIGGDAVQRTLQNAKNLLMCAMGEVPYDRMRGFDRSLYDLPEKEFREQLLPELDRMLLWEPDAEVVDAEFSTNENGAIVITATIDISDRRESLG